MMRFSAGNCKRKLISNELWEPNLIGGRFAICISHFMTRASFKELIPNHPYVSTVSGSVDD